MKFWIGVASQEHVKIGESGGFCQLCHGKERPLKRMKEGDYIVYYSSKKRMGDKTPYQKFSAIGRIRDDDVYHFEMDKGFIPFRRNVDFFASRETAIAPLIETLSFIADKRRWGYPFRYGHLEIGRDDFLKIAGSMVSAEVFDQLREETCKTGATGYEG